MKIFKKGVYIRWIDDMSIYPFDAYGVIDSVDDKTVTIITFDDFAKLRLSIVDAMSADIKSVSKEEIDRYVSDRVQSLELAMDAARLVYERSTARYISDIEKYKKIIKK